jgi:SAM-dependent methyltransferase
VAEPWLAADPYERYVGRWSRRVARAFIGWLGVRPGATWLDVGCGTGALAGTILELAAPARVLGVDPSVGFLGHARATLPGVDFAVADGRALPFPDASIDVSVAGLMLNFVPEPAVAVTEMRRLARARVGAYVWDYAGQMQMIRRFWDAVVDLDPAAEPEDEGVRFPICSPQGLLKLFGEGGLREVEVRAIDVPTTFRDFDDFWEPFLGGQGPAPAYLMSLGEPERAAIRERLRATLPAELDGSIKLRARAWAVRGSCP